MKPKESTTGLEERVGTKEVHSTMKYPRTSSKTFRKVLFIISCKSGINELIAQKLKYVSLCSGHPNKEVDT